MYKFLKNKFISFVIMIVLALSIMVCANDIMLLNIFTKVISYIFWFFYGFYWDNIYYPFIEYYFGK